MNPNQDNETLLAGGSNGLQKPAFLANFIEIAFEAIIAVDSQKRITFWNPAAEQMYGWTAREALGKAATELFWPVQTPQEQEDIRQGQLRLARGETIQGEYKPCRKDGSLFWVEYTARAIFDREGGVAGYVAVYRDITQRKHAQDEIRLISRIPAENPNPVMRLTLDGKILYANDASAPLLESWKRQLDKTIPEEFQQPVAEAFASGLKREIEIEHAGKNFSFILVPIREAGYVNCYGSEVTERKRIEQQLARERELLERLFQTMPVMVSIYDPTTNQPRFNAQFEKLIGWKPGEVTLLSLMEACYPDPEYRKYVAQTLGACAEGEWADFQMQTRDGRTLETSWSNMRFLNGMNVGIGIDITKRKRTEQVLAESARRQAALYQFVDQLHRTNTAEDVFNAALDAILSALQCDRASILLFDEAGVMRFVAWRGLSAEYREATEGHSPWPPDVENPEPVCVNDIDAAEFDDSLKAVIKREGIGSLIFIPLVSNGKLIGKFMAYFNAPHVFSGDELDLGLTIARQLAFGIDRKRTEEKLRESEERFRTLANTVPSIVWTAAPDGTILYSNNQWYEYTGISPEQNAREWPVVLHPDDYDRCVHAWTYALETVPDEYLIDVRNRRHDGEYRWFQTRAAPARDHTGKVIAWYGVTTDIHDRIEDESRLVLLAQISELMRKFEDPNELLYAVSEAVGEHLQVKRCLFNEIDLDHDRETVHRDYCRAVASVAGVHKISDYSSITSAEMRAGRTVVNYDSKIDPRTARDYERSYMPNGERAYVAVPMMRENQWVASLWVSDDVPRIWSREEVFLLESVAERTWTVIEKLRINAALRASEALYRTIARSIPGGGVYVVDKDYRYIVAEGPVTEAFGLSRHMLEGRTVSEAFPDERGKRMEDRLKRNFAGETVSFETKHNGRVYWTQQAPLLDSIGHAIIVTIDITERKQAEEALRQSEERFVRFMEHLPGLAWIKDVRGRYVYANAAAEEAFGTPREKLYGRTDQDIFPPEVAAQFRKNDERALMDGKGLQVIETLEQDDGVLHYSLVSKFPIPGPDGSTALIGGTAFDITERKQAEEALRENENQLQALNETLEQKVKEQTAEVRRLASDLTKAEQRERHRIAHILHDDLQQRLYAIQMQMAFLSGGLEIESAAAQRDLAEIKEQLDEVLAVTRHLSIDLSPPILHDEGLTQAIGWLASQMQKQHGLHIELQAEGSFAIPSEELQVLLFNCVRELLFNIVKHAGVNQAVVALQRSNADLLIEVQDHGRGFNMDALARPVDHEHDEDKTRRPSFGLPTLRHQLNLFGGQMDVQSEPGAGTLITLTIPVYEDSLRTG